MRRFDHNAPITDEDLSAFADGALSRRRAARVAQHLRSEPADAARVHAYWRQAAAINRAFRDAGQFEGGSPPAVGRRTWYRFAPTGASIAAVVVLAVAIGWAWRTPPHRDFAGAAFESYRQTPTLEQTAEFSAPALAGELEAVGERRVDVEWGTLTEYRYRRDDGSTVALYVTDRRTTPGAGALRLYKRGDTRLVEWNAGAKRYALVGADAASKLTRLAVNLRRGETVPPTVAKVPDRPDAGKRGPVIDTGGAEPDNPRLGQDKRTPTHGPTTQGGQM